MNIELAIALAIVLGLAVGLLIGRNARKERDERIAQLEDELTIQRNVVKSLNEDNVKLRKRIKKNGTKEN